MNLLIRDGRIVDITPANRSFEGLYPSAEVIDASDHLIIPGFVNAHLHPESVLLHPLTDSKAFSSWRMLTHFQEASKALAETVSTGEIEDLYRGATLAMLAAGATTVGVQPLPYAGDGLLALRASLHDMGIRSNTTLQTWEQITALRDLPAKEHSFAIGLGDVEAYTVYSFENLVRTSREMRCPLSAHIAEIRDETELLMRRFKKSPMHVLREAGILSGELQLVHCNHLPCGDLELVREAGGTIILCPGSTAAKRTGYPLLRCLAKSDVRLCVGTDWGSVDMLEEIRFLHRLPRLFAGIPAFSPLELLRMATINGAHALGLSDQTGSLEVGKKADLLMFSLNAPQIPVVQASWPPESLAGVLVGHVNTACLTHVMVDGSLRIQDRAFRGDGAGILRRFRKLQSRYVDAGQRREAPLLPDRPDLGVLLNAPAKSPIPDFLAPEMPEPENGERSSNLSHPLPHEEAPTDRPPQTPKKVHKIFGENDL
jgi:5-methylthioadenosine/S-adenosylhomocysteine deaminase